MDIAVAGVGAYLELDEDDDRIMAARIALAAVGPTPILAARAAVSLIGVAPGDDAFLHAAEMAAEETKPIDDHRGSAAYRRHLVGVLTRRALEGSLLRARGGEADG
jgi:carbon-monoxide dehydrogenase medium subunit